MAFTKGQSGNPDGRTPGKTPSAQLKKAIAEAAPGIIQTLIRQANEGDVGASKVLLDKVCPNLKSQSANIQISPGTTLVESGENILIAGMGGAIAPDISALLLGALSNQARLIEFTELEERISKLESGND